MQGRAERPPIELINRLLLDEFSQLVADEGESGDDDESSPSNDEQSSRSIGRTADGLIPTLLFPGQTVGAPLA